MIKSIESISMGRLQRFLSTALQRSYGTAMVMGNMNATVAEELLRVAERSLSFAPLPAKDRSMREIVEIPLAMDAGTDSETDTGGGLAGYRLDNAEPNENDENSACTFYFQLPSRDIEQYAVLELLAEIIDEKFYTRLRTQQQVGYIVGSGVKNR
jgi:secreted Zn-dependent insulinase-like peptidase